MINVFLWLFIQQALAFDGTIKMFGKNCSSTKIVSESIEYAAGCATENGSSFGYSCNSDTKLETYMFGIATHNTDIQEYWDVFRRKYPENIASFYEDIEVFIIDKSDKRQRINGKWKMFYETSSLIHVASADLLNNKIEKEEVSKLLNSQYIQIKLGIFDLITIPSVNFKNAVVYSYGQCNK